MTPQLLFQKIIHFGSCCQVALKTNIFQIKIENDTIPKGHSVSKLTNQELRHKAISRDALTMLSLLILEFLTFFLLDAPCLDILYSNLKYLKLKQPNIFKAPEAPKKVVPEEKVHEAVPKKPEVPPVKGTQHEGSLYLISHGLT